MLMTSSSDDNILLNSLSDESFDGELDTDEFFQRNKPSALKKAVAVTSAAVSIVATLPVPYLVSRSVYYLVTGESEFPFSMMLTSNSVAFWVFGPAATIISFVAIAPFNSYNAYKVVTGISVAGTCDALLKMSKFVLGTLLGSSGTVTAYIINDGYIDIVSSTEKTSNIIRYIMVGVGLFYAGSGDARICLDNFSKQLPRDYRYVRRGTEKFSQLVLGRPSFFNAKCRLGDRRSQLLAKLNEAIDDIKTKVNFSLKTEDLEFFAELLEDSAWTDTNFMGSMQDYFSINKKKFPTARFMGSEIVGSIFSGLLSFYATRNTFDYCKLAVMGFLNFIGFGENSYLSLVLANALPYTAYFSVFTVSFYLTRIVFFREVLKPTSFSAVKKNLPHVILTLFPSLSVGLLNVILTVLNDALTPTNKLLVAISSVILTTVSSRYGIEGGITELLGKVDERDALFVLGDLVEKKLEYFSTEQLETLVELLTESQLVSFDDIEEKSNLMNKSNPTSGSGSGSSIFY